ncbi:MAG: hypothetical protein Q8O72_10620 [Bacteroidales bacterium]|nr:hypothetical protein [Bacteroidales bacterium]
MGEFKDINGKTRIGTFLQEVAPDLLNAVGSITGVESLNKLGDLIKGTTELNDAQKASAIELLRIDLQEEQERTKRLQADMASDSWLSKNIRPMTLIYLLFFTSILIVLDSALKGFDVKDAYVTLITSLLLAVFSFYFVLRDVNKMIINRKK